MTKKTQLIRTAIVMLSIIPLVLLTAHDRFNGFNDLWDAFLENCGLIIDAGPDKFACDDDPFVILDGTVGGLGLREFYWEPEDGLSNPNVLKPRVEVTGRACYYLVGKKKSDVNLIVNGDFSQGNTGFTSDYLFSMNLYPEGTYAILTNPQLGHAGFAPCGDHTTGTGPMMVLNGSTGLGNCYCQNVVVKPNHDYCLSAWATSVIAASPAILDFTVNGEIISTLGLSTSTCLWEQMSGTWNSGASTLATVCITNSNPEPSGNDFALDDISMIEVCEQRDTVCVDLIQVEAVAAEPEKICCDNPIVILDGSGSSVGPEYTYCWRAERGGRIVSGGMTLNPIVDRPGIYILTVKGPMGCIKEVEIEVTGNMIPPRAIANVVDTLDCSNPEVRIFGGASPSRGVEYQWNGPNGYFSFDQNPMVEDTGKYILTVTDECGCSSTACITVAGKEDLLSTEIIGDSLDCVQTEVDLEVIVNQPDPSFEWMGPNGFTDDTSHISVGEEGWYIVKVGSLEGCESIDSFYVGVDTVLPEITILGDTLTCADALITLQAISPQGINFEWRKAGILLGQDSTLMVSEPGDYLVEIQGSNGCIDSMVFEVIQDTSRPMVSINGGVIDCGEDSTTLCLDTLNRLQARYVWIGPGVNFIEAGCIKVGNPGLYFVQGLAENGCEYLDSFMVEKKLPHPQVGFEDLTLNCFNPNHKIGINSRGRSIEWTLPGGQTMNGDSIDIFNGGIYQFQIQSDSFECPFDTFFNVNVDFTRPVGTVQADTLTCVKDSVDLLVSTSDNLIQVRWFREGIFISDANQLFTRLPGNYHVIIVGENGCMDTIPFEVNIDDDFPVVDIAWDTITCNNQSTDLVATANRSNLRYSWSGPGLNGEMDSTISVSEGGRYILEVESPEGCLITQTVDVVVDTLRPHFDLLTPDTIDCYLGMVNLSAVNIINETSGVWSWTFNQNIISSNAQAIAQNGGYYFFKIENRNGCSYEDSVFVVVDTVKPSLDLKGDTITCINRVARLSASSNTPNLNFTWGGGLGTQVNDSTFTTNQGGTYSVDVQASNGCISSRSFEVLVDTLSPQAQTYTDTINCSNPEVIIGYNSPDEVTSQWMGPGILTNFGDSLFINKNGTYTGEITANNGCKSLFSIIVEIDTLSPRAAVRDTFITCGNPVVSITGSASPNHYLEWKDENDNQLTIGSTITVEKGGIFQFSVTNPNNGCSTLKIAHVEDRRAVLEPVFDLVQPDCDNDLGGFYILQVQGGQGPYQYSLDGTNFSRDGNFEDLDFGKYALWVLDANGCITMDSFEINEIVRSAAKLSAEIEIEMGDTITLDLEVSPDNGIVERVNWFGSEGLSCTDCFNPRAFPLVTTKYVVEIIDTNGCTVVREILIKVIRPRIFIPNVFTPGNGDGLNDKFIPYTNDPSRVKVLNMEIYTRWGELVYSEGDFPPNNPDHGWDGTFREENLNPGVFVYQIQFELINGEVISYHGDVTIVD